MPKIDYNAFYYELRFKEALQSCEAALRMNPADEEALWVGAMTLRELGNFSDAINWLHRLLETNPTRYGATFYIQLLTQCLKENDQNVAHRNRMDARKVLFPQGAAEVFANDYNEMGLFLNSEQRFKDAVPWYDKAIELMPTHAVSWFNKGIALARLGEHEQAIDCFDGALENKNDYIDALYSKAGCEFELKRYGFAMDGYDRVLASNPQDREARQCREEVARRIADDRVLIETLTESVDTAQWNDLQARGLGSAWKTFGTSRDGEIKVNREQVRHRPYRFNGGALFVIAIASQIPGARQLRMSIMRELAGAGLLSCVVFQGFSGTASRAVEIGESIPYGITGTILSFCYEFGIWRPGEEEIYLVSEDGRLGYSQRVYIGNKKPTGRRLTAQEVRDRSLALRMI